MKSRRFFSLTVAAACLLLAAPAVHAGIFYSDPAGDTFGTPGAPDIVGVMTELTGPTMDDMKFKVDFASPINPGNFFGYLDIDNDLNPASGGFGGWGTDLQPAYPNSWLNNFISQAVVPGPSVNLGTEYYIDLYSATINGVADVYEAFGPSVVGTTSTVAFGMNSLEFTLSLSLLGGNKYFNYGLIVGSLDGPSDRAPNGAEPLSTVPEPSSAVLFTLMFGIGIPLYRRHRMRLQA